MDELDFSNDIIEKLLLRRVLSDKKWITIISNVYDKLFSKAKFKDKKTLFNDQKISLIMKLALKFFNKHSLCPSPKVIQLLAKKYKELHPDEVDYDLSEINILLSETSNMNYSIDDKVLTTNFTSYILKLALYETLSDNAYLLTSENSDFLSVVDQVLDNFNSVLKITFDDSNMGMKYFNDQAMKDHWEFLKNPEAKISTGWSSLDVYTNGGFLKDGRMLGLIMAQAGLGKSVFLSNLAVNFLKQNLSVVVISLEMSENVYAQRFDSHISKKNINKLAEYEETAVQRIKEFYSQYPNANLFIKEYPPRSIRSRDVETYLDNLKNAGNKIDVIIVDYLNLVLPNHGSDSMYKDGLSVSEELRSLSYKFNAPVISAVQANSEGMNNESIDMLNVSESRGIVHTADFLVALMLKPDDRENGFIKMRILKNRLGGLVGKICNFLIDSETLTVADRTFDTVINGSEDGTEDDTTYGNILKNIPNISANLDLL